MKSTVLFAAVLRIIIITALIGFTIFANAQSVAVNTTGNPADTSAMLDVSSNSKGFLAPRMTSLQRTGIPSPANGLLVFDTDTKTYWYFSTSWKEITNGGGGGSFALPYSGVYSDPAKLFSIANPDSSNGAAAIYGKGGLGIGIIPGINMGVWGDNSRGVGVLGTSDRGVGTYGVSFQNHGISGYTTSDLFAGVYGSSANKGTGIFGETQGAGIGVHGKSTGIGGWAGYFQNTNASSTIPTMFIGNHGSGSAVYVSTFNTGLTGSAVDIINHGSGAGISATSAKGRAAEFAVADATAATEAMSVTTSANFVNTVFKSNHTSSLHTSVIVEQNGLGRGIDIQLTKPTNGKPGLLINTAGNRGADIVSAGTIGIAVSANGTSPTAVYASTGPSSDNAVAVRGITGTDVNSGIGVLGHAGANDPNGIGVKGIAGGAISGGVGVLGVGNSANPNAIGVKGTSYTHNEDVGAVTGINFTDGVGVYGESQGFDGIGVVGAVGNTGNHSVAGMFKNNYTENNRAVVELISNGKGSSIFSDNTSLNNSQPIVRVRNSGTGKFLQFETNLGEIITTAAKNGDIVTKGMIKVRNNMGIVRNSTEDQLRVEELTVNIPAKTYGHYDSDFGPGGQTITVTFSTPFHSPPVVYKGNCSSGALLSGLSVEIHEVTTTGCKIFISNYGPYDLVRNAGVYKLVAMGKESN